ncbi:MAG: acetoin dehydrogenase dihydrolipoyllysine-residue acetyltransferase subunit [Hyphomicrobiales bacterium]
MNTITLPMPRLGETMEQGTISNWLVKPGEAFKRGDPLLELETDKTLVEYPALGSGTLKETLVSSGDVVDVGSPIAVIESSDAWMLPETNVSAQELQVEENTPNPETISSKTIAVGAIRATPVARKKARHAGVALSEIQGTGRRGRIEARDVPDHGVRSELDSVDTVSPNSARGGFLLVHGFAGDSSGWAALAASLQRGGHKVRAVDLPGHGKNEAPCTHPEDLVIWLTNYLMELKEPVHLVGHSLGAFVAANAAVHANAKVAQLTLVTPAGCGHEIHGSFVSGMAHAKSAGEISHLMRLLGPKAATFTLPALSEMASELSRGRLKALASSMARGDTQCIDTIAAIASLPENLPVSALFGVADTIIPKEHVFNMPPRVAVHVLRSGHIPQWDTPAQVERLLTQTVNSPS